MAKKDQGMNSRMAAIIGGVVLVVIFILIGLYGKNLTTQVYTPPTSQSTACATQSAKNAAQKVVDKINPLFTQVNHDIGLLGYKISGLEVQIRIAENAVPFNASNLKNLKNQLAAANQKKDALNALLTTYTAQLTQAVHTLGLPLCVPSPTVASTPKTTPPTTPTMSPRITPRP